MTRREEAAARGLLVLFMAAALFMNSPDLRSILETKTSFLLLGVLGGSALIFCSAKVSDLVAPTLLPLIVVNLRWILAFPFFLELQGGESLVLKIASVLLICLLACDIAVETKKNMQRSSREVQRVSCWESSDPGSLSHLFPMTCEIHEGSLFCFPIMRQEVVAARGSFLLCMPFALLIYSPDPRSVSQMETAFLLLCFLGGLALISCSALDSTVYDSMPPALLPLIVVNLRWILAFPLFLELQGGESLVLKIASVLFICLLVCDIAVEIKENVQSSSRAVMPVSVVARSDPGSLSHLFLVIYVVHGGS